MAPFPGSPPTPITESQPSPLVGGTAQPQKYDPVTLAAEVRKKYTEWRQYRLAHEGEWFVNAAMLRGQQHVEYNQQQATLYVPDAPSYATRIDFNKILPKHRARMAKFFKNRPKPVVVPASTEYQDLMDARASERALNYQWQRLRLESAYKDVRQWTAVCSKAYWFFGYDDTITGRVKMTDPATGQEYTEDAVLGDVVLETANAWEVLVPDPTKARIGTQEEILRVRSIPRSEAERRFPELKGSDIKPEESGASSNAGSISTLKQTEDNIAGLTASEQDNGPSLKRKDHLMLLELYTAPCGKYAKGRKVVTCGDKVVRYEEELPFEFWKSPTNPYPCVEFSDTGAVGQFWNTTWVAQLVPLQRLLNRMLELTVENAEAVSRPKLFVYRQHGLADGAYTSAAGEIVEINYIPGMDKPWIEQPASVSGDVWNVINLLLQQFDDVSQVHTASEGGSSGANSGYQTNLLQEATDAVHAPDIRGDELAIEDAAWKIRRIMKQTWDIPRLIAIGGKGSTAEMQEFSQAQIDDAAEVRIQIGSMLPDLKAARAETLMRLFEKGLYGDPNDPLVKRRVLALLGEYSDVGREDDRLDEDQARRENQAILSGGDVEAAEFMQQHIVHIAEHESAMKTPEWALLDPDSKRVGIAHLITHYDFVNLPLALGLRQQYGLDESVLPIAAPPPPPPQAAPPSAGQPAQPAAPPQATAPPQAPPAPDSGPMV